jgi:hypothetical protein
MKLSGTYTIPALREKVFAAITDPAVLQRVIDGCERMVKTGENSYDAHLKIGVAGLKGSYVGKVQLKDLKVPESYTLVIEGKGGPGFVKGTAKVALVEKNGQTELRCEADAQVGGLIAAVGSRLIEAAAKRMMDEFFRKFAEQVWSHTLSPPPNLPPQEIMFPEEGGGGGRG